MSLFPCAECNPISVCPLLVSVNRVQTFVAWEKERDCWMGRTRTTDRVCGEDARAVVQGERRPEKGIGLPELGMTTAYGCMDP